MNVRLILLRHGQSLYNLENRFTGWQDVELTETGCHEAEGAAKQLKNGKIDIAFTSALKRAQHTLQIILDSCGLQNIPVIKNAALNERSYGELEGLDKAETAIKYGAEQVHIWRRSFDVAPPGGESLKDTYERVVPYFKKAILPELLKGKNVLVVAHGNSLRSLIMFIESLAPEQIVVRELATCVPVTYEFDDEKLKDLEVR
ncbi:2,3-bisphosphoglycerate-dependent phosphoglycerate mutase [Parafilimonas terrae]|uniref:2,3-bisphosphoglycerate-dependent phosphoglycerate mutase n=1 Tax=Parafilimonas terrae TaxID=1465490 RepID=A0A1I5S9F1_9BACT|nr:2,3-bisphosphoglycerate-dependent phosphoglycerate mutase [Parafilimonas terrae]SFP67343.1 phosphoglycerate mutase [Parafilimonas terrae]